MLTKTPPNFLSNPRQIPDKSPPNLQKISPNPCQTPTKSLPNPCQIAQISSKLAKACQSLPNHRQSLPNPHQISSKSCQSLRKIAKACQRSPNLRQILAKSLLNLCQVSPKLAKACQLWLLRVMCGCYASHVAVTRHALLLGTTCNCFASR